MRLTFLALLVSVFLVSPACAEFYRYTDEKGVVRYTDNLADVPADQREKIPGYRSSEELPASENKTETQAPPESGQEQSLSLSVESLRKAKEELDKERAELAAERKSLTEQQAEEENSPEEQIEINEKIDLLNQKIADFEKKQEEYRKQVELFNRQIDEFNFRKTPTP